MHPILSLIDSIAQQRGQLQSEPRKHMRLYTLQRWQAQRLARTYADFLEQARYSDAIEFFMNDLYGPHDYTQRDHDLKRMLEPWQRILPRRALHAVATALELEALSLRLDIAMLDALPDVAIDEDRYATAYRATDQRVERERQIALILSCGYALESLIANPWVHRALLLAKVPAQLTGVIELHEFIERGYAAFITMNGAKELLTVIEQRETRMLNNLFAHKTHPFDVVTTSASKTKAVTF